LKILAVDDVRLIRTLIKQATSSLEVTVLEAENGVDALRILRGQHQDIDLVLLDWNMPKMNGMEVLVTIKQDSQLKDIPVIMTTTKNERKSIIEAIQAGASHYLTKPFTSQELIKKITDCTGAVEPFSRSLSIAIKETLHQITAKKITYNLNDSEKKPHTLSSEEQSFISGQINFWGREYGVGFIIIEKESAAQVVSLQSQQPIEGISDSNLLKGISNIISKIALNASGRTASDVLTPVLMTGLIKEHSLAVMNNHLSFTSHTFTIEEINVTMKLYLFISR